MSQKNFTNELGNAITVEVSAKEIEGVPGVLLYIEGPTSLTENHITRKEAEVIYEALGNLLHS
ncbi:hypothetical protein A3C89_03865 [Candidatus Kaiserbacteria bacterium RIFCSPHIGHO2_02_FULL_50_50]|uniref:Uncharacterized protein n=1 Tax=Candidatus Kaiserbacteria bacterium RIFCSPHIGHO2_02_FULL_50_50 TaxID=1798492 RepID=A0A1F6DF04_9BACT|nr:MAG: hypothetical protein A3C89_03865 [Candidatus Kaiserbacteria bacterium RIFCSPHIGHO2_02_FULL_50_50]OGG88247.1 MAG: hypothetical protein A3G62_04090 [Candidatus Kaiserbacteria bacterium RIFCSPLOWO2_12_FULL_50_10]